jgi:predicted DNA binding protein
MPGIRTELVFDDPNGCPVAEATDEVPGPVTDVTWDRSDDETVTEQVSATDEIEAFDPVFDYGSRQVYEFERAAGGCICETIQREIGPVADVHAEDGSLHLTLHLDDMDALREQITELREEYGSVRIEYLVQGREDADESEVVPVDVRRLTDRQREVIETAYEMGYFEYPRGANATEVADRLDIQPSTFTEHLTAAQGKLLGELVGPA